MKDINLAGNTRNMTDFLGNQWKYNCLGCAISEGKIKVPGGLIYISDKITIQQDPEIPIEGFLVINVRRHIGSIAELDQNEKIELIEAISKSIKALKKLGVTEEVTVVQEERAKHLHVWIFPNHPWMNEKFGKGVAYLRDISAYAQEYATEEKKQKILQITQKLKEYFKNCQLE